MFNVAIVEDDDGEARLLVDSLARYAREHDGEGFRTTRFAAGEAFLDHRPDGCDLVFMDIMLPDCNGMQAARMLRRSDPDVPLVFITSMSQYAVDGYEVDALDFIVKPLRYPRFEQKMNRIMQSLALRRCASSSIMVATEAGRMQVPVASITYVEVQGHRVSMHLADGRGSLAVLGSASLSELASSLGAEGFALCNRCYLVNLAHVSSVGGEFAVVNGDRLLISKRRRKPFLDALTRYVGLRS